MSASATPALGALLGAGLGAGLWLVVAGVPWRRTVDLVDRLEPYLADVTGPRAPVGRQSAVERLLAPVMADGVRWVERISGGPGTVRRRLEQTGTGTTVEQFRAEQVVWGVAGLGVGTGAALAVAAVRGVAPVPMLAIVVIATVSAVLLRDQALTWQVRRREDRMMQEFPTVAELLALSVGAGEGAVGALERVASTCSGELSAELRRTLAAARAGASLVEALEGLADRTSLPPLARFVDGVTVAVERGTPLAEVLRAQAQDVRELGRRRLLESGGRKEIAMMIPVVFLVLPVTVLFAVYPGLVALRLEY
ncbi:MAG: type II secretion system F family protein [Kineosporiaceae bacterium]